MVKKMVLLNDLNPELDEQLNGQFYDQETEETGVIYEIRNMVEDKSYIGRAESYGNENGTKRKHGATGRFREHWSSRKNIHNKKSRKTCRKFYQALDNSDLHDWYVFTIKVCPLSEMRYWETKFIKKLKTSDPKYGYNYFVGNNKPDNAEYLLEYQTSKALSNAKRAENGKMKRTEQNKKLPTYISYYPVKENNELVREGYMACIKINGKNYRKIFTSMNESMEFKLEKAKKYIKLVNDNASKNYSGSKINKLLKHDITTKGPVRKLAGSKNLPTNIRYYTAKKNGKIVGEGYSVEIVINNKRYKRVFTAKDESMESKLKKAKKHLEFFKQNIKKTNKKNYSGSKTNKKNNTK
jgi:hypothetical protein